MRADFGTLEIVTMYLPFAPILLGSLLLVSAPTNVPNERTECVQPSIYLFSYLLPTYLEWLTCPEPETSVGEPDSSIRLPLPQAAITDNANSQALGEF
jgi:hypothetical protein